MNQNTIYKKNENIMNIEKIENEILKKESELVYLLLTKHKHNNARSFIWETIGRLLFESELELINSTKKNIVYTYTATTNIYSAVDVYITSINKDKKIYAVEIKNRNINYNTHSTFLLEKNKINDLIKETKLVNVNNVLYCNILNDAIVINSIDNYMIDSELNRYVEKTMNKTYLNEKKVVKKYAEIEKENYLYKREEKMAEIKLMLLNNMLLTYK